MKRFKLESSNIIIGVCLFCVMALTISTFFWPTVTPPDKVVAPEIASVEPQEEEAQEEPQAGQESPEAPQGDLSTPAPPLVLPVPPPSVIEIPVEVTIAPAKPGGRCILRCRRGWFR